MERLRQYVAASPDVTAFYPTVRRNVQTKVAISFALGGESFYPELNAGDVVKSVLIVLAFAIFATPGPGLRNVSHRIMDLLLNRQRPLSLFRALFRGANGS